MNPNEKQTTVRQAVGVFIDESSLTETINELFTLGYQRSEMALLASEQLVDLSLRDFYSRTNKDSDTHESPGIAFVGKEALGETAKSLGGGLFFVGATFVMGGLVLFAALVGGAMLAAILGVVAVGVVGALVATISNQSDAEQLKEQVDKGHILLFVRIADAVKEKEVMAILNKHKAADVKMYDAPLKPDEAPESQGLHF